jgi:phosphoribosylamine--glycine ligase
MKVLVIGSGGREHAIAWKLLQSSRVQAVYVAPGNGGTALDGRLHNVPLTDFNELAEFAVSEKIALTVVGPEGPLAGGMVDFFRARGLRIFGPTKAAAQLESSKAHAKAFMERHQSPTASYAAFTDAAAAHAHVDAHGAPIVIMADGLAAGKGVVVAETLAQAHAAIDFMLGGNGPSAAAGEGQARVVIEEFLQGEEASFIVICDGKHVLPLATSQDHKRLRDGDQGPNTGGMGAYSPAPVVTPAVHARAMREVILPTVRGMEQDGIPFSGFLYAGFMVDAQGGVKTLEFNCRMGDPETQPIMMRLKTDLLDVLYAASESGGLDPELVLQWDRRTALGVVMAAHGYPEQVRRGDAIQGIAPEEDGAVIFHAGTTLQDGELRTSGGRVLCVTALADTVKAAQQRAYRMAASISFDGAQMRHDIGHRAIKA